LKRRVERGEDPMGERHEERAASTIGDLCDRYLVEHVTSHNKASTAKEARRLVEMQIRPALGKLKISDLTRPRVKAWHSARAAIPTTTNRALAALAKLMSLAVHEWEFCADTDPERPLSRSTLEHVWVRVRQAAEIPDGRLHDLRHTAGTYAAHAGGNTFLIRDLPGHRTVAMTGRYVERASLRSSYMARCRNASFEGGSPAIRAPFQSSLAIRAGSRLPSEALVGVSSQPPSRRTLILPLLPAVKPRSKIDRPSAAMCSRRRFSAR
jgi:hypothetical protein